MQLMVQNADRGVHGLIRRLPVKIGTRIRLIDPMNIMYVHACGDYVDLVMVGGETLHTKEQITHLQSRLPPYLFSRVHRSFIVNTNYVQEIRTKQNDYELTLSNGTVIASGSIYRSHIRDRFLTNWGNGIAMIDTQTDRIAGPTHPESNPEDTVGDSATSLHIRNGAPGDEHALALLGQIMFMESYVGLIAERDILAHCADCHTPNSYRVALGDRDTRIWIVETEVDSAPVGYLILTPASRFFTDRSDGEMGIHRLFLLDRYRDRNIYTRLLAEALRYVRNMQCVRLWAIECEKNYQALKFYKSAGFRATTELHARTGSTAYRDLALSLEI